MEERDLDRLVSPSNKIRRHHGATHALRVTRQAKTTTPTTNEQLSIVQKRIAEIVTSGRVREQWLHDPVTGKITGYVYVGEADSVARVNAETAQRALLWQKLGPNRVSGWFPHHFRLNGRSYSIDPYVAWIHELLAVSSADLKVHERTLNLRDTVIWLLWHFRKKGVIYVGKLDSKIRGHLRECAQCQYRFNLRKTLNHPDSKPGCPKCGYLGSKEIEPKVVVAKRIDRITKEWLCWRFKLSRRDIYRILSAVPTPREPQDQKT